MYSEISVLKFLLMCYVVLTRLNSHVVHISNDNNYNIENSIFEHSSIIILLRTLCLLTHFITGKTLVHITLKNEFEEFYYLHSF